MNEKFDYEEMIASDERLRDLWSTVHDTALPILCALIASPNADPYRYKKKLSYAVNLALALTETTMRETVERMDAIRKAQQVKVTHKGPQAIEPFEEDDTDHPY